MVWLQSLYFNLLLFNILYMCVHMCVHVCAYVCACVCTSISVFACVCVCAHVHAGMRLGVSVCLGEWEKQPSPPFTPLKLALRCLQRSPAGSGPTPGGFPRALLCTSPGKHRGTWPFLIYRSWSQSALRTPQCHALSGQSQGESLAQPSACQASPNTPRRSSPPGGQEERLPEPAGLRGTAGSLESL